MEIDVVEESNGSLEEFKEWQLGHFGGLSRTLQDGFKGVESKLDVLIDTVDKQLNAMVTTIVDSSLGKSTIQLSVAREMLERQEAMTTKVLEDQQRMHKWQVRTLCWTFGTLLVVVTGLRIVFPQWFGV